MRAHALTMIAALASAALVVSCAVEPGKAPDKRRSRRADQHTAVASAAHEAAARPTGAGIGGPRFEAAGPGKVDALVLAQLPDVLAAGGDLVVYVSASWCEPCAHMERAVADGSLADKFPKLVLLKFDHDLDEERLERAGYGGRMLPRFVIPDTSGRGSERRFEGSIKGPEAIADLVPKLESLLARRQ